MVRAQTPLRRGRETKFCRRNDPHAIAQRDGSVAGPGFRSIAADAAPRLARGIRERVPKGAVGIFDELRPVTECADRSRPRVDDDADGRRCRCGRRRFAPASAGRARARAAPAWGRRAGPAGAGHAGTDRRAAFACDEDRRRTYEQHDRAKRVHFIRLSLAARPRGKSGTFGMLRCATIRYVRRAYCRRTLLSAGLAVAAAADFLGDHFRLREQ